MSTKSVLGLPLSFVFCAMLTACVGAGDAESEENGNVAGSNESDAQPDLRPEALAHDDGARNVCADSLTVYDGGYVGTLHNGASFWIDHFADNGNHAWGWGNNKGSNTYYWGWVYNGWFC